MPASVDDLMKAAKVIEALTGAPPTIRRRTSRREKREQDQRVRRFLSFPPQLQEGVLRYGEHLRDAYKATSAEATSAEATSDDFPLTG